MTDQQPGHGDFNNLIDPEAVAWFDKACRRVDHQDQRRRIARQVASRPFRVVGRTLERHPLLSMTGAVALLIGGVVAYEAYPYGHDNSGAQELARSNQVTAVKSVMKNPSQLAGLGVCPDALRAEGQRSANPTDINLYDQAADKEQAAGVVCLANATDNEVSAEVMVDGVPVKVTPADILPRLSWQPALF